MEALYWRDKIKVSQDSHQEVLEGIIERITFHSEETGYTVAKIFILHCNSSLVI